MTSGNSTGERVSVESVITRIVTINFDVPATLYDALNDAKADGTTEIRLTVGHLPIGKVHPFQRTWTRLLENMNGERY
jgi:hypothetical protein